MQISLSKSGRSFSAVAHQPILEAALSAGLNLPHSCKGGSCGSCRARLLSGSVHYPHGLPLGISKAENDAGYVLLCQARADGDLVIESDEIRLAHEAVVKRLPCRVERTEVLSHDVLGVFLRLPAAEEFRFEAGQYLDVMLSGGRRRSFSIASAPDAAGPLELHVRRVPGGELTERLFEGRDQPLLLSIEGPFGQFVYRPPSTATAPAPMLLIGGGTGLAPLLALLRSLERRQIHRRIDLYWGVRGERDLYAHAGLEAMAQRVPDLRYTPVLSEPSPAWGGRRGWVHEAVLADHPRLDGAEAYASGPPAMIEAVRRELPRHGLPAARLYFDSFDYAPDTLERQRRISAARD
jgi:CDP-4-dehydro-6-deoxyglucose reductase